MFGLRKVYRMPPPRNSRWWQRWLPFGQRRQRVRPSGPQQQQPQQFVAVADSWFGVPKGQLLCLLGPNGAGKTTSINCLIGACCVVLKQAAEPLCSGSCQSFCSSTELHAVALAFSTA